ncbi:MAG TPA: nucleotidyltransferase domain-containing protein [Candidatus Kapabacteria bacterium]|nr:nucleotidyltransferase domain-containing protein [Candidatus Kapabacteria bacterium]
MITLEQIESLSSDIARKFDPDKIILFGSYAYGTPTAGSDADLLVIMPFEGHPLDKMSEIVYALNPRIAVDLQVRTPTMIERRIEMGDPFMKEILNNGRVLYERAHA